MSATQSTSTRPTLRKPLWIGAAAVFLLPAVAMLFRDEVAWGPGDFLLFGGMLFGACGAYELAVRLSGHKAYRLGFALTLLGMFVLVFANLAVGIVGSEDNLLNLLYFAIPAVGVIGALLARFTARGLTRALWAMAALQVVAGVASASGNPTLIMAVTAAFGCLWLIAAQAFRVAAKAEGATA